MKNYLLFFYLFYMTLQVQSQTISGIIHNDKGTPLPFASLILLKVADSTFVKGEISDTNGEFIIDQMPGGRYILVGSLVGYKKSTLLKIELQPQQNLNLGFLVLEEMTTELNEVVVKANKPVFEQKLDRLVMNINALPTMSGNTGLELLQKTPGLIVNRQANSISVLGKGEVLIMINNKIQRIPGEVLMARLQSMRAENIERIEVIHQPPAKYDASGAAGIINIVLKENNMDGTNSTLALMGGYGQREKAGANLNLNSRKRNINWFGDYNYNLNKANQYMVNHFREYEYQGTQYYHENFVKLRNYSEAQHALNVGLDANFKDRTVIGFLLNGATSKQVWALNGDSRSADFINQQLTGGYGNSFGNKTGMSSITGNLNLFQKIGSGNDLSVNIDYAKIRYNNSGKLMDNNASDHNISYDRSTPMQFWILSIDNARRIGTRWTMETGIKGTFNNTLSNTSVKSFNDHYWENSDLLGSKQTIQERIYAAYLSYKVDVSKKINTEFGIRYEHYTYQLQSANKNDFNKAFKNPFPIFSLNYKIDSLNTIQLAFNRSITRPSFFSLTSFLIMFDPSLIVFANPQLMPTFTNAVKASWQHQVVIWSLGFLNRKNQIYFYNTVDKENHLQTSTPTNLDNENIIETSLTIPFNPFRWWEMSWNLNAFYHKVKDASSHPIMFENDIINYAVQVNSTFLLQKGWSIGMDGMYRSPFLVGDQRHYVWPFLNLGVRKKFPSGSSLTFAVQDITNSVGKLNWEYHQPELNIKTYGHNDFSERQVRVTYSLLLGNQKLMDKRQRKTGSNDVKNRM